MKKLKIVVLDSYTLNPGDLSWEGLKAIGECEIYDRTTPEELMERAKGANVLLTNKTVINANHINELPELEYIGVLATGYNVVDIEAARKKDIIVTNIPAYSTQSVAQMVFAHILTITQRVEHYTNEIRKGAWSESPDFSYSNTPLTELNNLKIGIVGFGNIGQAVAKIAIGFGMEVYAFTSKSNARLPMKVTSISLEELLKTCDIITLHSPLTPSTRNLVNAERLALMKKSAILINTSRGPLVNEQDLADALNNGVIYAAGVDVLSEEPPKKDNPLLTAKNCFITPHIAWATKAARERLMNILLNNLESFQRGQPENVVN